MRKFLKLALVLVSFSLLGEEVNQNQSIYETHLSGEIYSFCKDQHLVDENKSKNMKILQTEKGMDYLEIIQKTDDTGPYIQISCFLDNPIEHFSGLQLGYRNQKLFGYAIFDDQGADYVPTGPIVQEDEIAISSILLEIVFPLFISSEKFVAKE